MQKRLFRGPTDRARDIIGLRSRVYIHIYTYVYIYGCKDSYTPPPADNYSGQLDIPRAYKHARTHTSVRRSHSLRVSPRCSANPIFDYATMLARSAIGEGNPIARFWNTHDACSRSGSAPARRDGHQISTSIIKLGQIMISDSPNSLFLTILKFNSEIKKNE